MRNKALPLECGAKDHANIEKMIRNMVEEFGRPATAMSDCSAVP